MKKKKGSLLLILVIVVAIIASLSAVALSRKGGKNSSKETKNIKIDAKAKARDAQRKSDIRALSKASELYKISNNKRCPSNPNELVSPDYISKVPVDPKTVSSYNYKTVGTKCIFSATLEDTSDSALKSDYDSTNGSIYDVATE